MSLFEENVKFLQREYPYIKIEQQEEHKAFWDNSMMNEGIVGVEQNGTNLYLNSRYEAKLWASQWCEQFENVTYRTKFIVLGIINGMYIQALHEKYPDNTIIFCEIYPELEQIALEHVDFSKIVDRNVFPVMGKERRRAFKDYLNTMIAYSDYKQIIFCTTPNYAKVDAQTYQAFRSIYMNRMEQLFFGRNTLISDEGYRRESFLNNLFIFPKQYVLGQLVENMKGTDVSDRAAIIVSAGPSLDKNIALLKEAKNKALLIAVDAAARPMVKVGVCPDLIVTIDPVKDESILQQEDLLKCPMVPNSYSHYKTLRQHQGPLYFPTSETKYSEMIYRRYGKEMYRLESGGSVANNALSLAELLGFHTVILVGQDLAYPNGKVHAQEAVYQNCLDNDIDTSEKDRYFEVDANDGGKVLTEGNMDAYRRWFEEKAAEGVTRIINATEGGARIKGTEIMTLKEALAETCQGKADLHFDGLMYAKETAFSKEQQDEIFNSYLEMKTTLVKWEQRLKEGIEQYHQLERLNRQKKNNTAKFTELVRKIGQLNEKLNESDVIHLLNQWGNKEEYEVLDALAQSTEDEDDEVQLVINGGIKMYQTYMESCNMLGQKWQDLLGQYGLK